MQDGPQRVSKPEPIVGLHEDAALPVHHDLWRAATAERYDGLSTGHRFEEHDAEALLAAWENENGAPLVFPREIAGRESTEKSHSIAGAQIAHHPPQAVQVCSVADYVEPQLRHLLEQQGVRTERLVDALVTLATLQPADGEEHRWLGFHTVNHGQVVFKGIR